MNYDYVLGFEVYFVFVEFKCVLKVCFVFIKEALGRPMAAVSD